MKAKCVVTSAMRFRQSAHTTAIQLYKQNQQNIVIITEKILTLLYISYIFKMWIGFLQNRGPVSLDYKKIINVRVSILHRRISCYSQMSGHIEKSLGVVLIQETAEAAQETASDIVTSLPTLQETGPSQPVPEDSHGVTSGENVHTQICHFPFIESNWHHLYNTYIEQQKTDGTYRTLV